VLNEICFAAKEKRISMNYFEVLWLKEIVENVFGYCKNAKNLFLWVLFILRFFHFRQSFELQTEILTIYIWLKYKLKVCNYIKLLLIYKLNHWIIILDWCHWIFFFPKHINSNQSSTTILGIPKLWSLWTGGRCLEIPLCYRVCHGFR